ncbi:related to CNS1-cyclophilin seven suppressor [Sporisorium reilianum SRZ2]|uniref:Related to CNS1-cyclophilin seven suppressor n=1 Tax=Sporisorium reilianum (strain SRZ2) TaxID=999809 RepID=E7A1Z4_SPORE|nr:related to CNS1-cyclophilin seven suppressor [Sporisorium reilianum SRZ2]
MAVIEPIPDTSKPALPKPPPRSGDFTYAQTDAPRDLESTLKSWDSVPLFMKDLPSDDTADPALEALQSLAFDGTPDEVAQNFKQQANDYFKAKRFREALGFYTQAIDASPQDKALLETLYANRAACNLELHNYGATLRDTSAVLGLNERNEKAYYRATRALIALERWQDAVDCAAHGLGVNADNAAISALKAKAEQKRVEAERRQADNTERARRKELLAKTLHQALLVRGLWLESTPRPPDNPQPAHFDPAALPTVPLSSAWSPPDMIRTPLILPLFFMYPQHAQSDFIPDFHEDLPLSVYLDTIFPRSSLGTLPWDTKREYYAENLQVYATTRRERLLKLGRKLTLREVMDRAYKEADAARGEDGVRDRDGLVMRDGVLSLVVLPRGEAEETWVAEFKRQRDAKK